MDTTANKGVVYMRIWYTIGIYASATAFVLDIVIKQYLLAALMAVCFIMNYRAYNNLSEEE